MQLEALSQIADGLSFLLVTPEIVSEEGMKFLRDHVEKWRLKIKVDEPRYYYWDRIEKRFYQNFPKEHPAPENLMKHLGSYSGPIEKPTLKRSVLQLSMFLVAVLISYWIIGRIDVFVSSLSIVWWLMLGAVEVLLLMIFTAALGIFGLYALSAFIAITENLMARYIAFSVGAGLFIINRVVMTYDSRSPAAESAYGACFHQLSHAL